MSNPCYHWHRILFQNAKTHLVPGALRDDLVAEMLERGCPAQALGPSYPAIQRVAKYGLDVPGPCFTDEPWRGFRLDNLPVSFPITGWSWHLRQAKTLIAKGARRFAPSDRPYFKMHGYMHTMVLLPRHMEQLVAQLEAGLADVELEARVWLADRKSPIAAFRTAEAKLRGVDPESLGPVAEYGVSSADAYLPPDRGEA